MKSTNLEQSINSKCTEHNFEFGPHWRAYRAIEHADNQDSGFDLGLAFDLELASELASAGR